MFKEGLNVASFSRDIHHVYFLVLLVQSYFDENGIEKFGFDADEYNFNEELPPKPQPLQIEDGYDKRAEIFRVQQGGMSSTPPFLLLLSTCMRAWSIYIWPAAEEGSRSNYPSSSFDKPQSKNQIIK